MYIEKGYEINGKTLKLEYGKFAKQANGAVMVHYGDTMVLAVAVASTKEVEGQDFLPLSIEYREKVSAVGKIPGGFIKREGKPSEKEILSARLIDRPIRPLFPENWYYETQVVVYVFSSDQEQDPDTLGAIGASAALAVSDIPFEGPIGEVRVCLIDDKFVINPSYSDIERAKLEIVVAGTDDSILMVEGEAKEVSEETMLNAIKFGHEEIKKIVALQNELVAEVKNKKREVKPVDEAFIEFSKIVAEMAKEPINTLIHTPTKKEERLSRISEIIDQIKNELTEKYPDFVAKVDGIVHNVEYDLMRKMILDEGKRLDGRDTKTIRDISIEVGLLPRTHGSALFTRGETQSLTTITLGTKLDEQTIDGLQPEYTKKFMLHYNFPSFSVGEVGKYSGPGRREIGHGNLAERSLKNLVPQDKSFPYTIRVVSDILESNGSSSMATVCAGSLALMDGGVPIPRAVAGIAMGLIKEGDKYKILSDILGDEDHLGDMDFKVAGTELGITGFQMDIKIKGISYDIMMEALEQARQGRLFIIQKMNECISKSRDSISQYAPHLYQIKVPLDSIGMIIGPGGKTIQALQKETQTEIVIEDDGIVSIAAVSKAKGELAKEKIRLMIEPPEIGKVYHGTVKRIVDFGAFVEIAPGVEGLLHISQIENKKIDKVENYLKVGDKIPVKLIKIEDKGRLSFSRRVLLPNENNKNNKDN